MPRGTIAVGDRVLVAVVHHWHRDNFYVAASKEGLFEQLYEFVGTWWDQELGQEKMPEDHCAAVDRYFERTAEVGSETYEWGETEIGV